jgi:hypothetical protein
MVLILGPRDFHHSFPIKKRDDLTSLLWDYPVRWTPPPPADPPGPMPPSPPRRHKARHRRVTVLPVRGCPAPPPLTGVVGTGVLVSSLGYMRSGTAERFDERRWSEPSPAAPWVAAPFRPCPARVSRRVSECAKVRRLPHLMSRDEVAQTGHKLRSLEAKRKGALRTPDWARTNHLPANEVMPSDRVETVSKTMHFACP